MFKKAFLEIQTPKRKSILMLTAFIIGLIAQFYIYRSQEGYGIFFNYLNINFLAPVGQTSLFIGAGLYVISIILFLTGFSNSNLDDNFAKLSFFDSQTSEIKKPWVVIGIVCLLLSISLIAGIYFLLDTYKHSYLLIWLVSLIFGSLGIFFIDGKKLDLSAFKLEKQEIIFLILLIIFCLIVLLPYLEYLPTFIETDEGNVGTDTRKFYNNPYINFWSNLDGAWPALAFYPGHLAMQIFGNNLYGLRMSSLITGILTVIVLYLGTRTAFNKEVAIITSIILASANQFIGFSRTGYCNIQGMLLISLLFLFLIMFLRTNNYVYSFFVGCIAGFGNYFYLSARLLIFIVIFFFLSLLITNKKLWKYILKAAFCCILGYLLVFLPYFYTSIKQPGIALGRANDVFYLASKSSTEHMEQVTGTTNKALIVVKSFLKSIQVFNYIPGETTTSIRTCRPILDYISSVLFLLGFFAILTKLKDARHLFIFTSLLLIMTIQAFTMDPPCVHRILMIIPLTSLIVGETLYLFSQKMKILFDKYVYTRHCAKRIALILLFLIVIGNFEVYFYRFIVVNAYVNMFDRKTLAARIIEKYSNKFNVYLAYGNFKEDFDKDHGIINVIEPQFAFIINDNNYFRILNLEDFSLPIKYKVAKDVIILVDSTLNKPLISLLRHYKKDFSTIRDNNNTDIIYVFVLSKELINSKIDQLRQEKSGK